MDFGVDVRRHYIYVTNLRYYYSRIFFKIKVIELFVSYLLYNTLYVILFY